MTWEALAAISSAISTVVVSIAAVAALLQIRHLRAGNQLEAILRLHERFDSAEMAEARRFVDMEFHAEIADGARLRAMALGDLDPRVTLLSSFYMEIGLLVVDGFIDTRLVHRLGPPIMRAWNVLEPLAYELRRIRPEPVWAAFEYVATTQAAISRERRVARYPRWFREKMTARARASEPKPVAEP